MHNINQKPKTHEQNNKKTRRNKRYTTTKPKDDTHTHKQHTTSKDKKQTVKKMAEFCFVFLSQIKIESDPCTDAISSNNVIASNWNVNNILAVIMMVMLVIIITEVIIMILQIKK